MKYKKYILTDDMELQEKSSLPNHNIDYVRKYFEDSDYGRRERKIVQMIHQQQLTGNSLDISLGNIVKILYVNDSFYDQEFLITIDNLDSLSDKEYNKLSRNVSNGLEQLHNMCIIYIDLHMFNIGYSKLDEKFKIFDFNMSGTVEGGNGKCNYKSWDLKPFDGILFKNAENNILGELCWMVPECEIKIKEITQEVNKKFKGKSESVRKNKIKSEISKLCRKTESCFSNFENLDKREFDFYLKMILLEEVFTKKHKPSVITKFKTV